MLNHWRRTFVSMSIFAVAVAVTGLTALRGHAGSAAPASQGATREPSAAQDMPRYDKDRALQLPDRYREWVFVGSSLGLSYTEGQAGHAMFHETLMEPSAYQYFAKTGTFREGTMFALMLHGIGNSILPGRRGQFAAELHGVEMSVKDASRVPEGWAYYNFGAMDGIRPTAQPMPKASCYSCHNEHAARDNVFLQLYPLLAEAAGIRLPTQAAAPLDAAATLPLALKGLDPVALTQGREEMGKPEIVASRDGYQYQFVSEPNRAAFAAEPGRYGIQNKTCLVVPGAAIDPGLFATHDGRIYAFATTEGVGQFKARPGAFVKSEGR